LLHKQSGYVSIPIMKHSSDSPFSAIESAIRATGSRVTSSRVRVLSLVQLAKRPLSHSDIEEELSKDALPGMDRVTLYRILDWLVDVGLAHKATGSRGVFCFSAAKPNIEHAQHMHFRCTDCGGVFCLDLPVPPPPVLPKGFRFSKLEFDISGECSVCAHSHPKSNRQPARASSLR
jgi:Fur family ferric uptake transcriptional regulator